MTIYFPVHFASFGRPPDPPAVMTFLPQLPSPGCGAGDRVVGGCSSRLKLHAVLSSVRKSRDISL